MDELGAKQWFIIPNEMLSILLHDLSVNFRYTPNLHGSIRLRTLASMRYVRGEQLTPHVAIKFDLGCQDSIFHEHRTNFATSEYFLTEWRTAAWCPPARPPTNTAVQRPMPSPSGSEECNPKAGPAWLGRNEGGQNGLLGS